MQQITIRVANSFDTAEKLAGYGIIVVAGVEAAKKLGNKDTADIKVIYTMLPLSSYLWLRDSNQLAGNHQVLYIDQPPFRFVHLVKTALPKLQALGFLYGNVSAAHVSQLKQVSEKNKINLNDVAFLPEKRLVATLDEVMADNDALLVLPDPYLFNRRSVQALLLASFRRHKPLIAYSESYVKAGALLALFSSPEQIGQQTAELISCFEKACDDLTKQEQHPKYFSVKVNKAVARQLGLTVPAAAEVERQLKVLEP